MNTIRRLAVTLALLAGFFAFTPSLPAYIGGPPMTLGLMCGWSTHVMIARVDRLDKDKRIIVFQKVRDIKGKWPAAVIRHHFNPALANRQYVMDWAEPGRTVVMCALESYKWSHTYIDGEWYAANTADWQFWNVSHSEPALLALYAGRSERLALAVEQVLAGKEVVVPVLENGSELAKRRGKYLRIKASLKRPDFNHKRDFVDWGKDDYATVAGMPGFSQIAPLGKVGADVQAICSADFDGDGKPDLCLVGAHKVVLVLNGGDHFQEISLPGLDGGCRTAVAADYNADGKPDLLLATPTGPRLYTNLGQGNFRDDTALLPALTINTVTAAAWIDYDGDGWPDILVANGYHGLRLFRNKGGERRAEPEAKAPVPKPASGRGPGKSPAKALQPWFEDRSDQARLGPHGAGAGFKGDTLTVCDVNGDGWPDFLYGAGRGILFLNSPHGFVPAKNSGIDFTPGKVGPVFADFNGDGIPDLFVPQNGSCKLYHGDGKGRFVDVTSKSGALAEFTGSGTSAAAGDFDNDGRLDLVIGCLRGPNRFFRNRGDGTFEDTTEKIGLHRRWFNTQAVCLVDLNHDGRLDMVFNNEGQESVVLLANPDPKTSRTPVTLRIGGKEGVIGSRVQIFKGGGLVHAQDISASAGRNQPPAVAHFALEPGTYRVQVRYSSGTVRGREIAVGRVPVTGHFDEKTPLVSGMAKLESRPR
jgi:hypothetical protein